MNRNIEKEYKVLVSKEQFETLLSYYDGLTFHEQINTYYDTKDLSIRKKKGAMRIRQLKSSYIFTLKMRNNGDLLEFEKEVDKNDVSVLSDPEIYELLQSYDIYGPFEPITVLKTNRAIYFNGFAELCFDISEYNGQTDYEIEYEYKIEHDGLSAFQKILDPIHVTYEKNCISKVQRAIHSLSNEN